MSLSPHDNKAVPLGLHVGRSANDYAEPSGRHIAEILRRFVQFIDSRDWRDERAKVFDALISLSYGAERSVARVPRQMILRRLTGNLCEEVISRAVGDLQDVLGMLLDHKRIKKEPGAHRDARTGGMMYTINPDPATWSVRWRLDAGERKLAIDEWAWVYSVNLNPQAPSLPLPSDVPGLAEALRELGRDAVLAHPLSTDSPPRSETGRTSRGLGTPDNKQRLCRQPIIGNEPAAGVREADTPAAGSPVDLPSTRNIGAVPTSGAATPTTSDTAALPAPAPLSQEMLDAANAETRRLQKARQAGHLTSVQYEEGMANLRRHLGLEPRVPDPDKVSSPANLPATKLAESAGTYLAHQLTSLAYTSASDVSEHLHPEHLVSDKGKIYLPSDPHPDVPDDCRRQKEKADGAKVNAPKPGEFTGNLVADLTRTVGARQYADWRGMWESYMACDRAALVEALGSYSLARRDPHRRKEVEDAGKWIGRVFRVTSHKWRDRHRGH